MKTNKFGLHNSAKSWGWGSGGGTGEEEMPMAGWCLFLVHASTGLRGGP